MADDETVISKVRLYEDVPWRPGLQVMVCAPGGRISRKEYDRLTKLNQVKDEPVAEPKEPEAPAPTLADLTRAELMVKLNEAGIEFDARAKHAELVDILGAAGV